MKKWLGHIQRLLQSQGGQTALRGTAGAAAYGFAAPAASEFLGAGPTSYPRSALAGGLGAAAMAGGFGPTGRRLARKHLAGAVLIGSGRKIREANLGFSAGDPNAVKEQARKLIGEEVYAAADRYLPQIALPDGTAHTITGRPSGGGQTVRQSGVVRRGEVGGLCRTYEGRQ
jgi:hypothetical protein